jgi:hypothetical protein
MRAVIDITDAAGGPFGDALPDPSIVFEDSDVVLQFGDVEWRMTIGQFDQIFNALTNWYTEKGADRTGDLSAPTRGSDD